VQILQDPISKINTAKWTRAMVQVEECLLSKHEALSSNPSATKKNKRKKEKTKVNFILSIRRGQKGYMV
jgi:hypothetical protein